MSSDDTPQSEITATVPRHDRGGSAPKRHPAFLGTAKRGARPPCSDRATARADRPLPRPAGRASHLSCMRSFVRRRRSDGPGCGVLANGPSGAWRCGYDGSATGPRRNGVGEGRFSFPNRTEVQKCIPMGRSRPENRPGATAPEPEIDSTGKPADSDGPYQSLTTASSFVIPIVRILRSALEYCRISMSGRSPHTQRVTRTHTTYCSTSYELELDLMGVFRLKRYHPLGFLSLYAS